MYRNFVGRGWLSTNTDPMSMSAYKTVHLHSSLLYLSFLPSGALNGLGRRRKPCPALWVAIKAT